jgi:hypothetical protein
MKHILWFLGSISLLLAQGSASSAADKDAVQQAIDRGVAYLKSLQRDDGSWPHAQIGATALAGLTLLECQVPPKDPSIQKAVAVVRQNSPMLTHTYSIALSILFLDRLGDPGDIPLIESMTVRLLAGQNKAGGWTYTCPEIPDAEVARLKAVIKQQNELVASGTFPNYPAQGGYSVYRLNPRTQKDLPLEIKAQLDNILKPKMMFPKASDHVDDNSNTQFATLALWVARRYGLPVGEAINRLNARFRASQNQDGGWAYRFPGLAPRGKREKFLSTATMTCAALLGLGVRYGTAPSSQTIDPKTKKPVTGKPPDLTKDVSVRAGLMALNSAIIYPIVAQRKKIKAPVVVPNRPEKNFYFLWSVERVAVAFGLKTIGGKDWYDWGSDLIVALQNKDGSWQARYPGGGCDTCFALLFLRRANLAPDLTAALVGKLQDPGEVMLKTGGVGVEDLLKSEPKIAIGGDEKSEDSKGEPGQTPSADAEASKLSEALVKSLGAEQEKLLEKLQQSKGGVYTEALVLAIPKLPGKAKSKARDALTERLTRMKAATLDNYLQDEDTELRRAAALACALKESKSHIPRLIEMLNDPQRVVERAAYAALKSLSGQDFGPSADASPAAKNKAIAAWKGWWSKQGGK